MVSLKKKKDEAQYGGDAVLFDNEAAKRKKKGLETQTIDLEELERQKKETPRSKRQKKTQQTLLKNSLTTLQYYYPRKPGRKKTIQ